MELFSETFTIGGQFWSMNINPLFGSCIKCMVIGFTPSTNVFFPLQASAFAFIPRDNKNEVCWEDFWNSRIWNSTLLASPSIFQSHISSLHCFLWHGLMKIPLLQQQQLQLKSFSSFLLSFSLLAQTFTFSSY